MTAPRGARAVRLGALLDIGLFALVMAALIASAFLFKRYLNPQLPVLLAATAIQSVVLLVAATALLRRRGEGWLELGLRRPASIGRTVALVVAGYLLLALIAGLLVAVVYKQAGINPPDLSVFRSVQGDVPLYIAFLILIWLSAAVGEEMLFRGFLWSRMERLAGGGRAAPAAALVLQAVVFGLAHSYQQIGGVLATGVIGLLLGAIYLMGRRNLVACILLHGLIDTVSFTAIFVGYNPQI